MIFIISLTTIHITSPNIRCLFTGNLDTVNTKTETYGGPNFVHFIGNKTVGGTKSAIMEGINMDYKTNMTKFIQGKRI